MTKTRMNIEISRLCSVMYSAVSGDLCVQNPKISDRGKVVCVFHSQKEFCCKVKRKLDTAVEVNKGLCLFSSNREIYLQNY